MYTVLSVIIAIWLPILLTAYYGNWKWLDFILRYYLAEKNRTNNIQRLARRQAECEKGEDISKTVISIVGYREDVETYEKALSTLQETRGAIIVAGIDGNDEEDQPMVETCQKVFKSDVKILNLPLSVGKEFYREIRPSGEVTALSETEAFQQASDFLVSHLESIGIKKEDPSSLPKAICFNQPHGDLKEIRLTSWTLSIVLGKMFGFEYLWSTDSDTLVLPNTISNMATILASEPKAGGASAYVRIHNEADTIVSRMVGIVFALDMWLNRATTGGLDKSEYLHGPASIFRLAALNEVIVPWCRFHYFFSDRSKNTVINEDIQYSMLLSKRGWQRLYVENAAILTGGPDTLRTFYGQRLRWSRGIMAHRFLDWAYIASEGPFTIWYMIRTAFYDAIIFILVAYYAIYGEMLLPVTKWDILAFEILPAFWNYVRCPTALPNPISVTGLYLLYRFVCPAFRMYTFITPFNTSWALPVGSESKGFALLRFIKQEHESLFFTVWTTIAATATSRALLSYFILDSNVWIGLMTLSGVIGWSWGAYMMFYKYLPKF